jgi:hypothetical protein
MAPSYAFEPGRAGRFQRAARTQHGERAKRSGIMNAQAVHHPTRALTEREASNLLGLSVATRRVCQLIEDAGHGAVATHEQGPKRLFEAVYAFIDGKRLHCSPRTIEFEEERLITLKRYFGDTPLTAITARSIAEYQRKRP